MGQKTWNVPQMGQKNLQKDAHSEMQYVTPKDVRREPEQSNKDTSNPYSFIYDTIIITLSTVYDEIYL